jgi:hypothetical protein
MERNECEPAEEAILSSLNINPDFSEGKTLLAHIRKNMPPATIQSEPVKNTA